MCSLLLAAGSARAQLPQPPQIPVPPPILPPSLADKAWEDIVKLKAPVNATVTPRDPGDGKQKSGLTLELERLRSLQSSARSYHSRFPVDARFAEAKKLEVLSGLQILQLGFYDIRGYTKAAANAYRENKTIPASDRFEVAVAMEWLALPKTTRDDEATQIARREKVADALFAEFGGIPEVYNQYLGLLLAADIANAARIARKLEQKTLPDNIKREVQRSLDSTVGWENR